MGKSLWIAYAKVGAFLNGDKTAGGQVGFAILIIYWYR
jgi:hypothetical protein